VSIDPDTHMGSSTAACAVHSANYFGSDIAVRPPDGDAFVGAIWKSGYYE